MPLLGEDTDAVLTDLAGLTTDELASLRRRDRALIIRPRRRYEPRRRGQRYRRGVVEDELELVAEVTAEVLGDDVGQEIRGHDALLAVGALELQLHVDAGGAGIALDQHQVGAVGPQDGSGFVDSSGDRLVGEHGHQSRFGA